jgi:uncharacterized protein YjbI with pentapeptide repeats
MANPEHVEIVKQGGEAIGQWRMNNPDTRLDLSEADLSRLGLALKELIEEDDWDELLEIADLSLADLHGANLTNAYLTNSDLRAANFRGADLTGADLRKANLAGAVFTEATFNRTDLYGAKLTKADLRGVFLRNARHLSRFQVDAAYTDARTQLPPAGALLR